MGSNTISVDETSPKFQPKGYGEGCWGPCASNFKARIGLSQLLSFVQPGDLLLYCNELRLGTALISGFTRSDFDHVSIIVRAPGGGIEDTYSIEALHPQVRCDPLVGSTSALNIIDHKQGVLFWRPLVHPGPKTQTHPHGKISAATEAKLWALANRQFGKAYQKDTQVFVDDIIQQDAAFWKSIFGEQCCGKARRYSEQDERTASKDVFCSELCAMLLMQSGIVRKEWPSESFLPKDLSSDSHSKLAISSGLWAPGYGAADELQILQDGGYDVMPKHLKDPTRLKLGLSVGRSGARCGQKKDVKCNPPQLASRGDTFIV